MTSGLHLRYKMKNNYFALSLVLFSSHSFSNVELNESEVQYETLIAFNSSGMTQKEASAIEGEAGPLITGAIGAIGGAGASIYGDLGSGNNINWKNAAIGAGSGFAAGATGAWIGGTYGLIAGVGAGTSTAFGMGAACNSCHD